MKTEPNYNLKILSNEVVDLLKKLLNKDLSRRIDVDEIPNHPWFSDVDFEKIEKLDFKAPFIPDTKNDTDINNIDPVFLNEDIVSPYRTFKENFDDNLFSEF